MKKTDKKVLTKDRGSDYYSSVAKARWDKVRKSRIASLAKKFEKVFEKMQGSTKEVVAIEIAKLVINNKIK